MKTETKREKEERELTRKFKETYAKLAQQSWEMTRDRPQSPGFKPWLLETKP